MDILVQPQPPPDRRETYGTDPNQFLEIRLPRGKGPYPGMLNLHGGYWRAKYDLTHAGHVCEALRAAGVATFNAEYRRVGNTGGGWPGSFSDVRSAYRYVQQRAARFQLDLKRFAVMGHSAGGQLALCLAAHETLLRRAIALAGVVDLRRAFALHLSHDAVVEFLGGTPQEVPEHYQEADPMELKVSQARQWLIHGTNDDTVPVEFSREYVQQKKKSGEVAELIEIRQCGHFDVIDPESAPFKQVMATVLSALA